ncbi:AIPR family protein [Chryseobacterium sp. SSA4.19]|uniref:AIPR family protein n=1 Tax=Chryseobacterium sp. SSA4.19 TaxID=2919915 RepID=UPI001F4E116A|nr:AIPR family protein [Chryseobacterium sp. SSA4.19]MCJ8154124.1 AIPR family protein [Chryseobacterium sp. SSA4.19]
MNLSEFAVDFLEGALITVEEEKISQEDAITNDILEYAIDSGEVIAHELCHYKVRGIKINAWNYDEENESIDLFVTIFKGEQRVTKVSDKDVLDAFSKAENFFWQAREGKLSAKVDESDITVFDLVQIIEQSKNDVKNVRIFVITNGQVSSEIIQEATEQNGVYIDSQIWDIERVHQQYLIRSGKQKIEIDFLNDYNYKLKCLHMDKVSEKVDAYIAIIPGKILASVYEKYRQGLLEKNVRTFLQFRARVNQGIRETIRKEPDMFFAYNNGISTTAEKVDIDFEDNIPYITRISNWQVVNGGQTTASIFATSMEKEIDLSKVFVQMKISVVQQQDEMGNIVAKISRFANTQTIIKDSDFSSNSEYHIAIENFSRTEWVPSLTGGKATNKWFYERTRGQYLDEKSKKTGKESKIFDREYPKKQKFLKTDLAKYEMSWWQRPFDVSKGAENNFKLFTKELSSQKNEVGKKYYQRLIAKAILFKEIDKIVAKKALGGYKANMVSYILAWLSYKSNKKLNLDNIWENQGINEAVNDMIEQMIDIVWSHINNPSKTGMNIGEWCKKPECWLTLKDKFIDTNVINDEIRKDADTYVENDLVGQELSPQDAKIIEKAGEIKSEIWFAIAKWAKENNRFTPFDRKLAYNLGILANRKAFLTIKQAKSAMRILKESEEEGFKYNF